MRMRVTNLLQTPEPGTEASHVPPRLIVALPSPTNSIVT
jgi:hypothetical protein